MFGAYMHRSFWLKPKPALLKPLESFVPYVACNMTYYIYSKIENVWFHHKLLGCNLSYSDVTKLIHQIQICCKYNEILTFVRTNKYNTKIFHCGFN
jgi:hypothetical protein